MKRIIVSLLAAAILLLPASTAFAQENTPDSCDFTAVLDWLILESAAIRGVDGFLAYLDQAAKISEQCADEWTALLFGKPINTGGTTTANDPYDGVLTAEEAVLGVEAAFSGDVETAALYICEDELEGIEEDTMPPDVTYTVTCEAEGDQVVCEITIEGESLGMDEPLTLPVTFDVVADKLCNPTFPE